MLGDDRDPAHHADQNPHDQPAPHVIWGPKIGSGGSDAAYLLPPGWGRTLLPGPKMVFACKLKGSTKSV